MHLTPGQQVVLQAFKDFGNMDDVALTVYVHHVAEASMSSSGIRSRRAELARKGLLNITDIKTAKSGRSMCVHGLSTAGKRLFRSKVVV